MGKLRALVVSVVVGTLVGAALLGSPSGRAAALAGTGQSVPALSLTDTSPAAALAAGPGGGYWLAHADGGVTDGAPAPDLGSALALHPAAPIVGMASTPDRAGYWLLGRDGGIFTFGDAGFFGSTGAMRLNRPVVGMAPTADGRGYWLVASDGGIFTFGDAGFFGSTGALRLAEPVVGMAPTSDGRGYWLVASDGGIFTFGDARFLGSGAGSVPAGVVGMVPSPDGTGYSLGAADGTVLTYGTAAAGSAPGPGPNAPAPTTSGTSPTSTTTSPTPTTTAPPSTTTTTTIAPPSTTTTTGPTGGSSSSTAPTPAGMRPLPAGRLYGVTVDDIDAGSSAPTVAASFAHMPTTRVVFDRAEPASYYLPYVRALAAHSYVMGELLDSSDMTSTTVSAEHNRVASYLSTLGNLVDIWEIGNEVNGNWTGPYSTGAAMVTDAFDQVAAAGKRSALTVFYNAGCGDGPGEPDPATYATTYLPDRVRQGVQYVLASYYQTQCNNLKPSAATFTSFFQQMRGVFPNAAEGFGEIGLPDAVTASTLPTALAMIPYYYDLPIDLPYYVGGHFWWYYAEDALPQAGNTVWSALDAAMTAEG